MLKALVVLLLIYMFLMAIVRLWRPSHSDEKMQRQMDRVRQRGWDRKS